MNKIESFSAGDELSSKSNYLWSIVEGVVKSYTVTQEGRTIIIGFWGKQEVVGKSLSNINPYYLQCLSDVKAILVPISEKRVSSLLLNHAQQIQYLSYIVRVPVFSDRLLLLLKWLATKFGREVSTGKLIDFSLTEQELADSLGIDVTIVDRTLSQFQQGLSCSY